MPSKPLHARQLSRHALAVAIALMLPTLASAQEAHTQAAESTAARKRPPRSTPCRSRPSARSRTSRTCRSRSRTISGEKLDVLGSGGEDVRFLSGRVPSLNIESSFGRAFPRFYIRGLGNTDFDLNASQPVSLVYDEVVQENPILKGFPVFDVERVEVLRGPQGTLFGRNTPGRRGQVRVGASRRRNCGGYGSVVLRHLRHASTSKARSAAARATAGRRASSALFQRRDDWVDNTFTGQNDALRGYDESAAAPAVAVRAERRLQRAAQRARPRPQRHRARVPRQHHQARHQRPGRRLRRGRRSSIDGATIQNSTAYGANARLRWDLGGYDAALDHRLRDGRHLQPRRHRRRLRRGVPAGYPAPASSRSPSESADGMPEHSQFTQEFRIESNTGTARRTGRPACSTSTKTTTSRASATTRSTAMRRTATSASDQTNDAWAVFGSATTR